MRFRNEAAAVARMVVLAWANLRYRRPRLARTCLRGHDDVLTIDPAGQLRMRCTQCAQQTAGFSLTTGREINV